jgi:hypothetical protein
MRLVYDIGLFFAGLIAALLSVSVVRSGGATWGLVQIPVIILAVTVFFMKESRLAALTVGLGIGLDALSVYPFFTWTMIVALTALTGWWLSKTVLTNRSLPSLIMLGAAMRIIYFIYELVLSRMGQLFGGSVWYMVTGIDIWRALTAFGIEMAALSLVFFIYVRSRGELSRMLTHL